MVAREGFDTSPRGKQLNDYELKYDRALRQWLAAYEKLTGERSTAAPIEPWRPPPYGTKSDEYCMGPAGKPAGRGRSGTRWVRDAGRMSLRRRRVSAAGGSRSEPATVGTGADQNRGATAMAAGGSRSEPATVGDWGGPESGGDRFGGGRLTE